MTSGISPRRIAALLIMAGVVGAGAFRALVPHPIEAKKPTVTKAYALVHYAAWCHLCKDLDPKLRPAIDQAVDKGVEFVTLDFTSEDTGAASVQKAKSLGLDKFVQSGGTGFVVLVDSAKSKQVGTITSDLSRDEIAQRLSKATQM